jgi:hypothetical protein
MCDVVAATRVRLASHGWRHGSVSQALIPEEAVRALAHAASEGGRLREPLLIVTFESPLATRMLAFLQDAPVDVLQSVEGILPITHAGRLNEAIVAAIARAPAALSACDAANILSAHVSKPYIRRSVQRLLSVDHVAGSFVEILHHPPIRHIIDAFKSSAAHRNSDAEYTGPRMRCMTWPPEAQKRLVSELEAAGAPLGASVGSFTHLLCVVHVHYATTAQSLNTELQSPCRDIMLFGLLPLDHLPLGPSPDELSSNHAPAPSAAPAVAEKPNILPSLAAMNLHGHSHCRAQYKLHEAIDVLRHTAPDDFVLRECGDNLSALRTKCSINGATKTDWRAIDVGAAPGGWSAFLAGPLVGCSKVMAVDAARLAPAVFAIPSVCHVQSSVQDALVSGALTADAPYDILVADLNADPRDCARWISPLFPLMRPGSMLVLTMKLPYATVDSEIAYGQPIIQAASELLSFGWTGFDCRWLTANTVNERTLFAFRRGAAVGPAPPIDTAREDVFNVRKSHQFRKARALLKKSGGGTIVSSPQTEASASQL